MAETLVQAFLGNVGIGTDDPGSYTLDIVGGSTSTESIKTNSIQVGSVTNAFIPYGIILAWSGTVSGVNPIPSGWALCDGNNGTPDLRSYFVIGGGSTFTPPTDTGGATSRTLTTANLPSHRHYVTTGSQSANHNHSTTDPGHGHASYATDGGGVADGTTSQSYNFYAWHGFNTHSSYTGISIGGNDANHNHDYTTNANGQATPTAINILPPYYALAYIMKT